MQAISHLAHDGNGLTKVDSVESSYNSFELAERNAMGKEDAGMVTPQPQTLNPRP